MATIATGVLLISFPVPSSLSVSRFFVSLPDPHGLSRSRAWACSPNYTHIRTRTHTHPHLNAAATTIHARGWARGRKAGRHRKHYASRCSWCDCVWGGNRRLRGWGRGRRREVGDDCIVVVLHLKLMLRLIAAISISRWQYSYSWEQY